MAEDQEVNADLSVHIIIHSNDMEWEETGVPPGRYRRGPLGKW